MRQWNVSIRCGRRNLWTETFLAQQLLGLIRWRHSCLYTIKFNINTNNRTLTQNHIFISARPCQIKTNKGNVLAMKQVLFGKAVPKQSVENTMKQQLYAAFISHKKTQNIHLILYKFLQKLITLEDVETFWARHKLCVHSMRFTQYVYI